MRRPAELVTVAVLNVVLASALAASAATMTAAHASEAVVRAPGATSAPNTTTSCDPRHAVQSGDLHRVFRIVYDAKKSGNEAVMRSALTEVERHLVATQIKVARCAAPAARQAASSADDPARRR